VIALVQSKDMTEKKKKKVFGASLSKINMERTTSEDLAVLTQSVKEKKELLSSPHLIKVFVSSSFRDFSEERDLLSKLTFPRLRRLCNERDLVLVEVNFYLFNNVDILYSI